MNLLRFFKKEKAAEPVGNNPVVARPVIEKPASERFGKTVLPNAARVIEPDGAVHAMSEPAAPKSRSLGGNGDSHSTIAVRATPAPAAERTVALQLAELIPQIPVELLGGGAVDPAHRLIFNAAELERGMANGRPAVSLRSIYQQAPTIFTSEVAAEDTREVPLPFHKVLEQFASLQVRADQEPDADVPQVETPFLQVTLEDSEKFGTPLPAPRAVVLPPAPVAAPTPVPEAATPVAPMKIAGPSLPPVALSPNEFAQEPKPAIKMAPLAPIRLSMPDEKPAAPAPAAPAPNEPEQPKASLPVAPKLFPNGAGAPIPERVPASSGSSAPIPLPSPLAPARPATRIPFKVTPPASDLCPPPPLKLNAAEAHAPLVFSAGPRLRLSLRNVLRGIPPFQIDGSIESVPEDAKIELPFAIVQPQLSLGRVAISPAQFQAAMPEEFRSLYRLDEGGIPVSLPLPEILQNLPNESLQIREDQEDVKISQLFETPFSQKAAEDATRLNSPTGRVAKPAALAAEPKQLVASKEKAPAVSLPTPAIAPEPEPAALSELSPRAETPDAKSVVSQLSQLAGIKACAVVFSDGLSLAGNLPDEYEADALCGIAPEIMKRLDQQMSGANLGDLHSLTIYCAKAPVSFFAAGAICLAALHSTANLSPEVRDQLGRATQELARIYAQPALA
ncbi:MAG: hypothetical protein ABI233_05600 [Chthoniobacterales bacterium]